MKLKLGNLFKKNMNYLLPRKHHSDDQIRWKVEWEGRVYGILYGFQDW